MLRFGTLALALGLAGCAATSTPPELSQVQLCADMAGLAGREIWLTPRIDPSSILAASVLSPSTFSGDSGLPCSPGVCCLLVPYLYHFACTGADILIAPASLGDGSEERYPELLERTLECGGNTDGTPMGGAACRPTCPNDAPNITQVRAIRGVLAASETTLMGGTFARPVFVFSAREVILFPEPDAAVSFPDVGPPLDVGIVPNDALVGESF